ncbi:GNAT family N-acetyltransferase [Tardiphaga alba]|uniref:GNAT family N-acetyltransferase n=1 Tax=Tardiphaga alba TaxID=340268 RepID=A0ABX8A3B5_9BRAD|nr:GNAT family N-acetyltransferase [Tardiphaga alba]
MISAANQLETTGMRGQFDLDFAPFRGCRGVADHFERVYSTLTVAGVTQLYPGFDAWFATKVIPGLRSGERRIITCFMRETLAGVAICKRTESEAKLCTLWVAPEARGRGAATELAKEAFAWLGNVKPLFTVPDERLPEFQPLLRAWSFSDHVEASGMYRPGRIEHVFNSGRH